MLPALADIFGVSERTLLDGNFTKNNIDAGSIKKTRFYVCPYCGSTMSGTGESQVVCCGKPVTPLRAEKVDAIHSVNVTEIENDFYIEFNHEMTKDHYINFVVFMGYDRLLMIRMYPEQSPSVRFHKMYRGMLYFYCNKDGLFGYRI